MYTWCEADWYNGPSCGSSALCQINITYPCHYNLVSPSLSPLYLILLTFLFILKRGLCFRSLITGCFFFHPLFLLPSSSRLPSRGTGGGVLDKRAMSTESRRTQMSKLWILGHYPPPLSLPRPPLSLSLASTPCSGAGRSCVRTTQSVLTCVSQDNHS